MKLAQVVRSLALAVSMLMIPAIACANVKEPKGFDKKVYDSSFALYGSSAMARVQDRFICTVTAYQKVQGGYLLIGAGHCTGANPELPPDLTFTVRADLGKTAYPVALLKSVMDEPLDYAIYFLPTTVKYHTVALGDEGKDRVGDRTVNVNFSLGVAKFVSPGVIVSPDNGTLHGFFFIDEFATHGASGSSVVSEKTHKIIGLVIAGWDGATMPMAIEPLTSVEKQLDDISARLAKAKMLPVPTTTITAAPPAQDPDDGDDEDLMANRQHNRGSHVGRPSEGGRGDRDRRDGRVLGQRDHRRIDRRSDVRVNDRGRREIFFGGYWFGCGPYEWPMWIFTDDVYFEMIGPDIWMAYDYDNPTVEVIVYVVE